MESLALAGFGASRHEASSALGATLPTLPSSVTEQLRRVDNPLTSAALAKEAQPSTRGRSRASSGQAVSARRAGGNQTGWNSLPWVRMLRSDPFYARLVNTYLLTNGIWVLLIHSVQSNRFSYLSWFMMPWVLLYPFVPGRYNGRPRTGLIAAVLCAHYLFTYVMMVVVYPLRGWK